MAKSFEFLEKNHPERIVCLTEEPTEILYSLGEGARIAGISAYTVRPPEAKRDHPVVSAFIQGNIEKIVSLKPDLVIGFSDIQADLARDLIQRGLQVLIFNQRTLQEIFQVILTIGGIVGKRERAVELCKGYEKNLLSIQAETQKWEKRPRVYFEEWDDPRISGIRWVSELIEIAGGEDVFSEKSKGGLAKERFVTDVEGIEKNPDVIVASWCGKPVDRASILKRPGWETISAIQDKEIYEIDSSLILQPGPACLTDGVQQLFQIFKKWESKRRG